MKYKYNIIFIPFNYYRRTIIRLVYNFPVMMWQYSRIRWMFAWIFSKKKNSTKLQSLGSNLLGFSRLREKKTMYKKLIPLLIIHFFLKKKIIYRIWIKESLGIIELIICLISIR